MNTYLTVFRIELRKSTANMAKINITIMRFLNLKPNIQKVQ